MTKGLTGIAISDTHNKHESIGIDENTKADFLFHSGDFSYNGYRHEIESFNYWLGTLVNIRHKVVCLGNHELLLDPKFNPDGAEGAFEMKSLITNAIVLNQTTIELDGIKVYGEPRQPEFFDWAFNVPRNEMKDVWALAPNNIDVLLTHGPPFRCGDMNREGENVGCFHQREWIKKNKPRFVICGHIHEGYGRRKIGQTQVFNASCLDRNYKVAHKPIFFDL